MWNLAFGIHLRLFALGWRRKRDHPEDARAHPLGHRLDCPPLPAPSRPSKTMRDDFRGLLIRDGGSPRLQQGEHALDLGDAVPGGSKTPAAKRQGSRQFPAGHSRRRCKIRPNALRLPDHPIGEMGCEGEHRQNDDHQRRAAARARPPTHGRAREQSREPNVSTKPPSPATRRNRMAVVDDFTTAGTPIRRPIASSTRMLRSINATLCSWRHDMALGRLPEFLSQGSAREGFLSPLLGRAMVNCERIVQPLPGSMI